MAAPFVYSIFLLLCFGFNVKGTSRKSWIDVNRLTEVSNDNEEVQPSIVKRSQNNEYNYQRHSNYNLRRPEDNFSQLVKMRHPFSQRNSRFFKTYQRGSAVIPYRGSSSVNVSTSMHQRPHRGRILTTIITPEELNNKNHTRNIVRSRPALSQYYRKNNVEKCIICPQEKILIANKMKNKVILTEQTLKSCNGKNLSPEYEFKHIYGPKEGDLLPSGSHVIVGKVLFQGRPLQTCQYKIHIIVQQCKTLNVLPGVNSKCSANNLWGSKCEFSCISPKHKLLGSNSIECNDEFEWTGESPVCIEKKTSCSIVESPQNARVMCKTPNNTYDDEEFPEGTKCRVRCKKGFVPVGIRRKTTICRDGEWARKLYIFCKKNNMY